MPASDLDRIAIAFPGATPAEAAIIAQECAGALQEAGVAAEDVRIARSEADAMDLGGLLVVLGGLGFTFIEGAVKGVGEQAGRAAWQAAVKAVRKLPEAVQRVLESISNRHRTPVQIQGAGGAVWTIGNQFKARRLHQRRPAPPASARWAS